MNNKEILGPSEVALRATSPDPKNKKGKKNQKTQTWFSKQQQVKP